MFNFLKPPAGGAALAAPATLSGKRPRKEVEASEVPTLDMETLTQIVVMLTKYSLQTRQITDRLAATTFVSMTMNKSSKLIVAIKEAVDRYNTMQASHSPDQREAHGPPSIHLIGVILAHACSSVKEDNKFQMDCKEKIQKFIDESNQATPDQSRAMMALNCPHIYVHRPFNKALRRLEMGVAPELRSLVISSVIPLLRSEPGFKLHQGTAPKGALTRQLQDFLDSHAPSDQQE